MGGQAELSSLPIRVFLLVGRSSNSRQLEMAEEKKERKPRNYVLGGSGVMRYSHSKMYHKKGIFAIKNKEQNKKAKKPMTPAMVTKDIRGENNGEKRTVRVSKMPKSYPTQEKNRRLATRKTHVRQHTHKLRPSITPGTVLILLAGKHKGKRVVFLKQLESGLLLVSGPFCINGCPLRRINQIYVIATKTKLDISGVHVPEKLNDAYYRRQQLKKPKQGEGEIFDTKKEEYVVSEERKADQLEVDKQLLEVIRAHEDKKLMFGYLKTMFSLKNHQYPHKMMF